jgi:biotin transporter BioY
MGLIFLGLVGLAVRCERSAVKVLLFLMVGAAGLPLAMPICASRV